MYQAGSKYNTPFWDYATSLKFDDNLFDALVSVCSDRSMESVWSLMDDQSVPEQMVSGTCPVLKIGYRILNNQMEDEDQYYQLELPIQAVRIIYTGLKQACEKWSGGDPVEQEDLLAMRDHFYRIMLEHRFTNM